MQHPCFHAAQGLCNSGANMGGPKFPDSNPICIPPYTVVYVCIYIYICICIINFQNDALYRNLNSAQNHRASPRVAESV